MVKMLLGDHDRRADPDPHVDDEARDRAHAQHLAEPVQPVRVAAGSRTGRPPFWPRQQLIDCIRFRVRTGALWRDVPREYRPRNRTRDLHHRWQRDGTKCKSSPGSRPRRCQRFDRVWPERLLHGGPRSSACGQARNQGELQKEPPRAYSPSWEITDWDAHAAGPPPSCTWSAARAKSPCRS